MAATGVNGRASTLAELLDTFDVGRAGTDIYAITEELFPICRSITGDGLRQSLAILQNVVPLTVREIPSGTQVFDWTIPDEWNIRDAYIADSTGARVVDFRRHALHVVNYSSPVAVTMTLAELRPHLHTLPEAPDWIPYRTSYYTRTWGFCLSQNQLDRLTDGDYEVRIDATLQPGHLSYGEYAIRGDTTDEVLISCHSCHPSLANDNLSGMAVAAMLARLLQRVTLRHTYRFLWIPGTIGAITWLALNEAELPRIKHGLVLSCVGDSGPFTYKRSRRGSADIDRAVEHVLRHGTLPFRLRDFIPYGYDERQYCSPGINLPVGCFMRTPNGEYPEYHTSADNLSLITAVAVSQTLQHLLSVLQVLEGNAFYQNLQPKCEPQLGRRGLYAQTGGLAQTRDRELALLWVLNGSDGTHDLLDIANRAGLPFAAVHAAAATLQAAGLVADVKDAR